MLWIPGPTHVRPELLALCARPLFGHRSPAMEKTLERMDPGLRLAFGLTPDSASHVAVHSVSATAMMESSLIGAGPRILSLVNGAFARRWSQIAGLLGKETHVLDVPWGEVVGAQALAHTLREHGPFDAVTVVASETSTGAATPLAPLAKVLDAHPQTLLLVDVVSWIAGAPVDFDANRLDFAFAGVQKALALPPGISVLCASERYMERCRAQQDRGFALDPERIVAGHALRKTPATPAIPQYVALAQQLEDISLGVNLPESERHLRGSEAWTARFAVHEAMRARTHLWAESHGLQSFPDQRHASPTVSCLRAGDLDVAALVAGLAQRDLQISNGYGALKGETFRIGHMGDHTLEGLEELLCAADEVLASLPAASA